MWLWISVLLRNIKHILFNGNDSLFNRNLFELFKGALQLKKMWVYLLKFNVFVVSNVCKGKISFMSARSNSNVILHLHERWNFQSLYLNIPHLYEMFNRVKLILYTLSCDIKHFVWSLKFYVLFRQQYFEVLSINF